MEVLVTIVKTCYIVGAYFHDMLLFLQFPDSSLRSGEHLTMVRTEIQRFVTLFFKKLIDTTTEKLMQQNFKKFCKDFPTMVGQ